MVSSLQMIASRNVDPLQSVVVSVTKFHAGQASNIIPDTATFGGTVRTLKPEIRDQAETRIREIAEGLATAHGATATVSYARNYPVTVNHAAETAHAQAAALAVAGEGRVNGETDPMMGGEDFSYMLNARPGAFIFLGNGDSAGLHNPNYDFNDEIIPHGISYWVRLAESRLSAS
jgi:hippurate hydrolase